VKFAMPHRYTEWSSYQTW